ncbi:hypothetical protein H5410_002315 [Solanum commersonii]|uniref:Uncharacterized protein n=1 Tax=Solanum commersonii TaxID=4109 RepID=A0A9J6B1J7_SOLCO|nr:hypothetical protein H5410_002315 [Solanum commersonii]
MDKLRRSQEKNPNTSHNKKNQSFLVSSSSIVYSKEKAGIVVVLDFDKTIIDVDSDNWVVDELGATDLFNQLLSTMPWNTLMDRMMEELHVQGKTIAEVLKRVPIHPRIVPAN